MNKQALQERLDKLMKEQEQIKNMLLAYDGAIQECQHWLGQEDVKTTTE